MTDTVNDQYLDWAEKAAVEHLRCRLATGDVLLAQASQLLALLLAAMAGALALGSKIFTAGAGPAEWGAATVAAWLGAVATVLTLKAIATRETQTLYNEPQNLYQAELLQEHSLSALREFELQNMQGRIDLTKRRNSEVAWWLDACRYAAAATPVVFALAAWAAG